MGKFYLNGHWVAIIAFIVLLAGAPRLHWSITALTLGAGGIYLLVMAWRGWGGGGAGGRNGRVTYWRGQRIEMHGQPRQVRPVTVSELAPVVIYALLGLALIMGSAVVVISRLGL